MIAGEPTPLNAIFLGGASVDLILRVPRMPEADEKILAEYVAREPGGLVANTACAAARLGLPSAWTGRLGQDADASFLLADFLRFGVDSSLAEQPARSTTDFTIILLSPGGQRTILVVNTNPAPPALPPVVLEALGRASLTYTLPYEPAWFERLARRVHESAGKLAVDVEESCPLEGENLRQALRQSDLVFCSRGGMRLATGMDQPEKAARDLIGLGIETLVITLGAEGAWAFEKDEQVYIPAFPVTVIDTTGAGDCLHAAFLATQSLGWDLNRRLTFASAAAALSIQQLGARGGFPNFSEVENFIKKSSI